MHRARSSKLTAVAMLLGAAALPSIAISACASEPRAPLEHDAGGDAGSSGPDAATEDGGAVPDARVPFDASDEPVACAVSPCAKDLVAGDDHFCARFDDGMVRCWGDDTWGQLGRPDGDGSAPRAADVSGAIQISAAGATTCAKLDDGGVTCWGSNAFGQLGHDVDPPYDEDPHPLPAPVDMTEPVLRVDVGQRSACAVTADGRAICWGSDRSSQLARGEPGAEPKLPGVANLVTTVRRTAAGLDTVVAIATDGALLSWGAVAGPDGVLSGRISSVSPTPTPSVVHGLAGVVDLAVSGATDGRLPPGHLPGEPPPPPNQHACAITDGAVHCWGKSERGALGSGLPDAQVRLPTLARLFSRAHAQRVAAGGENTCVRMTDGAIACTGENQLGQLGNGAAGPFSSTFTAATSVAGRAVQVAVSRASVCALLADGGVVCWGSNAHGEIGTGTPDQAPHPTAAKVAFRGQGEQP